MWQTLTSVVSRASVGDWLLLAAAVLLLLWVAGTWNYDYFARRGIASTRPRLPFLGDSLSGLLGLRAFPDLLQEWHEKGRGHAVFGIFDFVPIYMIRDPELLKVIAVKNFEQFMNHRDIINEYSDPIFMKSLFLLKDEPWREMRATLSPAFTTSKMRAMFPLISQCGQQMADHLRQKCSENGGGDFSQNMPLETNMKDLFSRIANDVIASVAFGLKCDSLKEPENEFYHKGKALTNFTVLRIIIFFLYIIIPKIAAALGLRVLDPKAMSFFDSIVHETIRERQKKGIFRPDMLQLLMQAREGSLKAEAEDEHEAEKIGGARHKLTNDDISGQAVSFFFAGFETVSTALCFTSYALSHHPEIQKRLQKEIDEMMKATGGEPTYEAVQGMKYLDSVINESLRLYPPLINLDRICGEDTTLPATRTSKIVSLKKGDIIVFSTIGIHCDPEHWEEPHKFNPHRFSDENKHKIKSFTFMPFGLGPRMCIGQRFAIMEVKVALIHLLVNFDIRPSPKTKHPMQYEKGFNMNVRGGFWSNISPREVENII